MKTYPFWRKAASILWVLIALLAVPRTMAQPVNELTLMGHHTGYTIGLIELGDYYYYDYAHAKQSHGSAYLGSANMLERYKFDKTNYSFLHAAILAGDTTQFDSAIIGGHVMHYAVWNGNIAFATSEYYDTSYHAWWGLTLSVLDTALHAVIPQRRLKFVSKSEKWTDAWLGGITPIGERLGIFYNQTDSGKSPHKARTRGMLLDKDGSILKDTSIGSYDWEVTMSMPMPGKGVMLWGYYMHVLLDSNLAVVDTFEEKPLNMPNFPDGGYEIALPSGTLIKAGEYGTTALCRLTAASRYASDSAVFFLNGNNESPADGNYTQSLQYNTFDNRIYYANALRQSSPYLCLDSGNYIQVICTDTLLRPLWRKFITLGPNICSTVDWVAASDGRGGAGIMGYHYDMRYNFSNTGHSGSFLFHLDSTGTVSVASGLAPVVRDRLKIYPNPATDAIIIDDILNGLSGFALYDMSGRRVNGGAVSGKLAKASLEGLSAGPYILRVTLSDGSTVSQTVVKR